MEKDPKNGPNDCAYTHVCTYMQVLMLVLWVEREGQQSQEGNWSSQAGRVRGPELWGLGQSGE